MTEVPAPPPAHPGYRLLKRLLDLFGAVVTLIGFGPVMLAIAAAIRLDSPGPALFRQERVGEGGRSFTMVKFRTMTTDNDPEIHRRYIRDLVAGQAPSRMNEAGEQVYLLDDPRVTRVGRWLRRTSLDELPNLFNVLAGSMSLVGPRPPIPYEVELYDEAAVRRVSVKPGMTGLAQVRGRGTLQFHEIVALDLEYVGSRSLWLDVRLLVETIPAVLARRGV